MLGGNIGAAAVAVALLTGTACAIELDIHKEQSIKDAAATAVFNTMSNYTANQTSSNPKQSPRTWWENGIFFSTLMQYWYFTGDASNNAAVSQGMYDQRGKANDYMPQKSPGFVNDDQMTWGLAAMTAAELNYPRESSSMPSWISLAENVFNSQVARWDNTSCDGGMRWAIEPTQSGYTMKNARENGGLFQLSARLARYTDNQTYAHWAEKIWDWSAGTALLDTKSWRVADSVLVEGSCKRSSHEQWTYNYGPYISGAAYMYNMTKGNEHKWRLGLDGLLKTTFDSFFPEKHGGKIMSEVTCEPKMLCGPNQDIFKGILASDLVFTSIVASHTASDILPRLQGSAVGAAKQCSGGSNHTLCGRRWYDTEWDGSADIEEQISAASLFSANLVVFKKDKNPATLSTASNTTQSTAKGASESSGTTTSGGDSSSKPNSGSSIAGGALGVSAGIVAGVVAAVQAMA
ncbi:endo mannanase GH76 family [Penicillium alfredii]|uniref:Mannan endo-1,6-alpha-mannosidase n=1 Tax=Penicillium alfredii TaxID=1506179 RepID=A0A9W9F112_9EURO|nr:endo mannanase GH76 family [Penicillium alfredii]KAJ5091521.1 endo mannanase GH76 family [Penicillium alfredii]